MGQVPKLRMLQLGICRNYLLKVDPSLIHDDGTLDEAACEAQNIHSSLARMRGLLGMLEGLPCIILALPYGILADKKGRRLVGALSVFGSALMDLWTFLSLYFYNVLPLKAVYAGPFMTIIGGGQAVGASMLLAMLAASVPVESRTRALFWMEFTQLLTELIAPVLGTLLLRTMSPYFVFLIGIPIQTLGILVIGFIPASASFARPDQHPRALPSQDGNVMTSIESNGQTSVRARASRILSSTGQFIRHELGPLLSRRVILVAYAAFLLARAERPLLDLTVQWMWYKFEWVYQRTNYLLSIQAAAQIPLFTLVLPAAYHMLMRRLGDASASNLALSRGSALIFSLGSLFMGLSPTSSWFIFSMMLYILGKGYVASIRSLIASLASKDQLSLVFTASAVVDGLGTMAASPLIQLSFAAGLNAGGLTMSLPFFITSALFLVVFLLLCCTHFDISVKNVDGIEDCEE
ncbi:hypothetical protein HIM_05480 [Hirsutella minnesotensis 3608]|uniref:Major facilitator superfamily (MFS) profile domain-containing protein n=1 Tax=Hirsutella minnesotensis 3608 TaxID=1043627 RepID=A0A0F8A5A6_9HYPO|nr:hypothetical protein HIM_05480 [Hirsutella minnesotensis 3608]